MRKKQSFLFALLISGVASAQSDVTEDAKQSGQIQFEYQTVNISDKMTSEGPKNAAEGELRYQGVQYCYVFSKLWTHPNSKRVSFFFDGKWDGILEQRNDGQVDVSFAKSSPPFFAERQFFNLWPGPSLVLGENVLTRPSNSGRRLSEMIDPSDRSTLKLEWEGAKLVSIKQMNQGGVIGELSFEHPDSLSSPVRTRFWLYDGDGKNRVVEKSSWVWKSARFGERISESMLIPNWYSKGQQIRDLRVSPAINWSYEELVAASKKTSGLTPDELYDLSLARAKVFAVDMEKGVKRAEEQRSLQNKTIVTAGLGFIIVLIGSVAAFMFKNMRDAKRQQS